MSRTPKDGGPAFPATRMSEVRLVSGAVEYHPAQYPGMSLRDWLTGQVLAGAVEFWLKNDQTDAQIAQYSVEIADAVIARLES